MTKTIHVQSLNPNYQNYSVSYDSTKIIGNIQSFQDKLLQNQKEDKDSSQNISELVGMMKDNIKADFKGLTDSLFNSILDSDYKGDTILQQTHSQRYQRGRAYIIGADENDDVLLHGFGTNIFGTQWGVEKLSIVKEETTKRDFTIGGKISNEQYQESMNILTTMLDKVLDKEFAKDSNSPLTNALLILRAELDCMPEIWEMTHKQAVESLQNLDFNSNAEELNKQIAEIGGMVGVINNLERILPINVTAAIMLEHLSPDEQQEMFDAVHHITMYFTEHENDLLPDSLQIQLKQESSSFKENLASRFTDVDNAAILLNLSNDLRNPQLENHSDTIRSKLKTTDDSILQKVMSKMSNAPKNTEANV